ncbi:unnamed protein product [Closterium sp. NIES-54]
MEGLLSACLLQPRALALGVSPCLPRTSSRHPRTRLRSAIVSPASGGAGAAWLGSKWLGSRNISAARNLAPGTVVSCPSPMVLSRGVARPVVVATAGQTPKAVSGDAVVAESSESAPSTSSHAREVTHFYRHPLLSDAATESLLHKVTAARFPLKVQQITAELPLALPSMPSLCRCSLLRFSVLSCP